MSGKMISWKENKVISIETRKNVFVLAQMLKRPYLKFYNLFNLDNNWENVDLNKIDTLFVNAVTNQFLKFSNISEVKNINPKTSNKDVKLWIKGFSGNRKVVVFENTEFEKEIIILGSTPGGLLVERSIYKKGKYEHPSGLFDKVVIDNIPLNKSELINNHELMSLAVFPSMNERLFLCYKKKKNVDPFKDLRFDKKLVIDDHKIFIEIISSSDKSDQEKILQDYFTN
ncbi:hypothetical protein [uncultured Aquimarina sp.]|uniref:hypothetical protein n=1 Tax=uncultured Aquimarina sp. TaxID=575652 RepID=UPI00261EC324|nr:hypothetical protein [uncultured Aquimarina sp.]